MVESSRHKDTAVPHAYPQNDLDKAIEQAQATKDLVSHGNCGCIDLHTDRLVAA